MPRAADLYLQGGLPTSHNPLDRIDFQPPRLPDFDLEAFIEQWMEFLDKYLFAFIKELTGIDLSSILDLLESINVPTLSELIEIFTGVEDGDLNDLGTFGLKIRALIRSLLTGVPSGMITDEQPNLWPTPTYPAGAIRANPTWTVDSSKSKTADGSGAAKVIADGSLKSLRSGENPTDTIPVVAGSTFESEVFVSHTGYVGAGAPVLIQLVPFTEGVAGEPILLSSYTPATPDVAWPGVKLVGEAEIPDGVTEVQLRILVTGQATSGTFWFDDGDGRLSGDWQNLPDSTAARFQLFIDTILSALTKLPIVGGTLEEVFEMLGLIPPDNVQGAGGPATIFDSIFGIINALLGGLVGSPGSTGGSMADLTHVAQLVAADAKRGFYAWELANVLNNTPVARGFLPTGRANYDWASTNTYVETTQSAALATSFGLLQAMPIGVLSWYGYGTSGMTAFYLNVRKVGSDGTRTLVHHSANIVGNLQPGSDADDADWMFYELPSALAGEKTDNYWVEFVPVGGTHYIRGMSFTDNIKDHPTAAVPSYGAVVDYSSSPDSPAATLPKPTASPHSAWVEFAVSVGDVDDYREPQIFSLDNDGESIPIPSWANRVDLVPLGKGGDGRDSVIGFAGNAGEPGRFAPITLARGEDFDDDEIVTFNVLADGSAKLSIPGVETVGAAGADGVGTRLGGNPVARGPGILEYNGQKYVGGGDQSAPGGDGTDPGGGGNGGRSILFQNGGAGGRPVGWVCFRQEPVDDEASSGDTTPPTPPTITLAGATYSSLAIQISGGEDE